MDLKPGDKAPAFKLPVDGGGHISSASLKGNPYVLYFYPQGRYVRVARREAIDFSKKNQ